MKAIASWSKERKFVTTVDNFPVLAVVLVLIDVV
jgi:hypothetical protein